MTNTEEATGGPSFARPATVVVGVLMSSPEDWWAALEKSDRARELTMAQLVRRTIAEFLCAEPTGERRGHVRE